MSSQQRVLTIKAIPTEWNGYKFRSRLEARWAVAFATLGIKFEYEAEGFELQDGDRYLPDFYLPQVDAWAEVKPDTPSTGGYMQKAVDFILAGMGKKLIYLIGPPEFCPYEMIRRIELPDGNESWITNVVLDIYQRPRWFFKEGRLIEDVNGSDFKTADDFSDEYREAVYLARGARFYRDNPCGGGDTIDAE